MIGLKLKSRGISLIFPHFKGVIGSDLISHGPKRSFQGHSAFTNLLSRVSPDDVIIFKAASLFDQASGFYQGVLAQVAIIAHNGSWLNDGVFAYGSPVNHAAWSDGDVVFNQELVVREQVKHCVFKDLDIVPNPHWPVGVADNLDP